MEFLKLLVPVLAAGAAGYKLQEIIFIDLSKSEYENKLYPKREDKSEEKLQK